MKKEESRKEHLTKLVDKHGATLKEKLLDPVFFINEIIGFDMPPYHLTPYQEEWIRLIEENDRINFMAFRSSGKTEALLVCYPIFKAFTQPGWQGIVTSANFRHTKAVLRRIKEKVLANDLLRTSVPTSSKTAVWSAEQLQFTNGSMIWAKPNTDKIVGEHVDFIAGDELGVWEDLDIVEKAIPPMVLAKGGKIVYIGTPTSNTDPIHELMKNPAYVSRAYPVTAIDPTTNKTLWELRYPHKLMKETMKEYGSLAWSREFMLKPLSSKDKLYPYELIIHSLDPETSFTTVRNPRSQYYLGLDFALSGEAGSDYTVYTVMEKDNEDRLRVVNMERYKGMSYQAQKLRITQLAEYFRVVKITADEGSFGKSFIQDIRANGFNVEGFRFTNESKQALHTNLRNLFEQKRLAINADEKDAKTKQILKKLLEELDAFGVLVDKGTVKFEGLGEHDDMVTSLALAAWSAKGAGKVSWTILRGTENKNTNIFKIY